MEGSGQVCAGSAQGCRGCREAGSGRQGGRAHQHLGVQGRDRGRWRDLARAVPGRDLRSWSSQGLEGEHARKLGRTRVDVMSPGSPPEEKLTSLLCQLELLLGGELGPRVVADERSELPQPDLAVLDKQLDASLDRLRA